jgi:mono/diheme cytochrome c family protein
MKKIAATTLAVVMSTLLGASLLTPANAGNPAEIVATTEKGQLKNPLSITPEVIEQGKALYQSKTCGACHGGTGSGIHCPSLINDAWIYGSDDDTLFRLITVGSEAMLANGHSRGDKEKHAGPMPSFSATITDEQDLWKIITYIRSLQAAGAK